MAKFVRTRKYLYSIFLWIIVLVFAVNISFASVYYLNMKKTIILNEQDNNRRVLDQINYNIEYMNENIVNLCKSLYFNSDIVLFMRSKITDNDIYDVNLKLNTIGTSMREANPFIHSIYFYNDPSKTFYSSYNGMINYSDTILQQMMQNDREFPKLKPIYRKYMYNNKSSNVFTYLMYSDMSKNGFDGGAVAINIESSFILNNIKYLNGVGNANSDAIIIFDADGNIITTDINSSFLSIAEEVYKTNFKNIEDQRTTGFLDKSIHNNKYMVSYSYVKEAGFFIIKIQDYYTIYKFVKEFGFKILFLTILLMAFGIIIAVPVSYMVYRPVNKLVGFVGGDDKNKFIDIRYRDELTFLRETYEKSYEKLYEYKVKSTYSNSIMKSVSMNKLLEDSTSISNEEFQMFRDQYGIELNFYEQNIVCLASIDNYKQLSKELDYKDRELYKFAIINITDEILSQKYRCQSLDLGDSLACFILQAENFDIKEIETALKLCQENLLNYFKLPISFAISQQMKGINSVNKLYSTAYKMIVYRFLRGNLSIIKFDEVSENISNIVLPKIENLEEKLIHSLRLCKFNEVENVTNIIFDAISKVSYNSIILSLMHLINSINIFVEQINKNRFEPLIFDGEYLNSFLLEANTIYEFKVKLVEALTALISENKESVVNDKHKLQVQAAINIIETNYSDSALCKDLVATQLRVSSKQLGKIFNEQTGLPIQAFINEIRLKKAVEWMENSKLNTYEIIQKVGFENESYFYAVFKKKYGTTPRDYILRRNIKEMK